MVQIRSVGSGDDVNVKELISSILEKEFQVDEKDFFGADIEQVSQNYAGDGETFFIAEVDNQVVGTVGIKREDERNALMRRIFVKPEYRKRKIGYQLIQEVITFCKDQGYEEIIFKTTSRMDNAIRLCEANGFVKRATIQLGNLDLHKFSFHIV